MSQPSTLPEYMMSFFRYLRDLNFLIGIKEMAGAYQAVEMIDISEMEQFKQALKIVLASSKEEEELFEQAFYQYFIKALRTADKQDLLHFHSEAGKEYLLANQTAAREDRQQTAGNEAINDSQQKAIENPAADSGTMTGISSTNDSDTDDFSSVPLWSATRGSAQEQKILQVKISTAELQKMKKTAKRIIHQINLKQSRRMAAKKKGHVLDLPKTLRKSFRTGAESFELIMKGQAKQKASFCLLCDTSRSMTATVEQFLQFALVLTKLHASVEVFLFSTNLARVTNQFYSADENAPILEMNHKEWGDGTCIGESLHAFVEHYAGKVLRKDTVVIIASDGLDAGETAFLQRSMNEIAIQSAAIIWVNPLLAIEGYEPTARAMAISLPYIKHFLSFEAFQQFNSEI